MTDLPDDINFLDLEQVREIHQSQLDLHGGSAGLRDEGLLRSALSQPEASFGGKWLHAGLHEMASAYLFSLVSNHPVRGWEQAGWSCGHRRFPAHERRRDGCGSRCLRRTGARRRIWQGRA